MSIELEIERLTREYPDVVISAIPNNVLYEIARRYLADKHAQLSLDAPRAYTADEGRRAVAVLERQSLRTQQRIETRQIEREVRRRSAAEIQADNEAMQARIRNQVNSIVREAVPRTLNWSEELLNTTFSVGHNAQVSWGEATVEQHEARAVWLEQHAATRIETASNHRKAAADLREAGVRTLGDLVSRA